MNAAARLANHGRLQALMAAGALAPPKQGRVTSYDPDLYAVKVELQPEAVETGWLPIQTLMAGQGWGIYAAPAVGDQATLLFQEGDRENGWCVGFLPSDADPPPHVPTGEIHVVHKAGAFLKFLTDGTVHIEATAGIKTKGPWDHDGTLHTTQEINCDTTITASTDVVGGGKHLKTHVHGNVQAGGSNTGQPV